MLHLFFTGLWVGVGFIFAKILIGILFTVLAALVAIVAGVIVTGLSYKKGRRNGTI